ncbi:hypothetical protein JJB98_05885 [Bradyrhizobium diazoefficiens]|nr:hypothetical protein [Bradyrhizobium diazoefficiens]QQO19464.1 hypothetical protein JJB98_05885 [Bradyrhizobium diazoefficiens]
MSALEVWNGPRSECEKPNTVHFGGYSIYIFLIALACLYYEANARILLGHYDLGWHLAAGDLIRSRGRIPFQDPWAFTLGDKQWINLSWLWDVIASVVYQYAGFDGIAMLVVACGAIIVGFLTWITLGSGASSLAVCTAVLAASVFYPAFATPPNVYLAASPNTSTMVLSVIFYAFCLRKKRYLLPPLMIPWANLHGGFVMGLLIIGLFGGVALLRRDWVNFKYLGFTGVACLAATLINPLGWHIYIGVIETLGHFVQAYITEWRSYFENIRVPGSIAGLTYILIFVALELRQGRSVAVPVEARLFSWLFLGLGFYEYRYMSFFYLFSTIPLALHFDLILPKQLKVLAADGKLFTSIAIVICALPLVFMLKAPALALSDDLISEQDAIYLKTNLSHARVLNHWNVGGPLIARTHGAVPVFIDGRAATAYPDSLLRDYFRLAKWDIDESAWVEILEKYEIDAVLWPTGHDVLRRFLVDKRGWKEQYVGIHETLYTKP